MRKEELFDFVAGMELAPTGAVYPRSRTVGVDIPTANVEQSFLNAKSLISFTSAVGDQNRKDILNSTLFAQLAANKKYPEEAQVMEWYKYFIDVLSKLGWVIEYAEMSTFTSNNNLFEVESVIIDILTSAFGASYLSIITKTLTSIKSLGKDGRIKAFEKNTHTVTKGAFQIGLAVEENNSLALNLGTFLLQTTSEINTILFFKSAKDAVRLDYCSRKGTLNTQVYSHIRSSIVAKLAGLLSDFVVEIEI